jgi:hypothetical protein
MKPVATKALVRALNGRYYNKKTVEKGDIKRGYPAIKKWEM